jgi:hypothetical protein
MKTRVRWWACCGLWVGLAAVSAAGAETGQLVDEQFGFSLELPALGAANGQPVVTRAMILGPASDGFAPNLNVQVQYDATDVEAYVAVTRAQLAELGVKLAEPTKLLVSGLPAVLLAYQGDLGSGVLSHQALAVVGRDRVWLATCSMTPAQAKQLAEACRQSLLSLRILGSASR